ncbi:hypothetical protein [Nonomuraea sp. NPDC003754]
MLGGAAEPPPTPVSCTTRPDAGTYHLIDFKEVAGRVWRKVRTLRVRPSQAGHGREPC